MKERTRLIIGAVAAVLLSILLTFSGFLYSFDKLVSDSLYQRKSIPNDNIKIIAIDEATIARFGDPSAWTREIPASLVEALDKDLENAPAVIAFDMLYVTEEDEEKDNAFARACEKYGNVVTGVNVVYRDKLTVGSDGSLNVDSQNVAMVEYPYDALKSASDYGFVNTYIDKDQFIRTSGVEANYQGETIDSLDMAVWKKYAKTSGTEVVKPKTTSSGIFYFKYIGNSGSYSVISMADVLDGKIDSRAFKNSICYVGAYAPGMGDSFNAAIQHGKQMYGVEIHANILQALMTGQTAVPANRYIYGIVVALAVLLFYILLSRTKIITSTIILIVALIGDGLIGRFLYDRGTVIAIIDFAVIAILIYVYYLVSGYLIEILKKRQIISAFKKYVAPQVVDEISKSGDFEINLGGQKRHIAVLFVDIRGFTPMSEGLQPEEVVDILNEYLALTTKCIFQNGGTLDKYIGDATMAVFNSPFNLDDYIFRAVCTAWDIAAGSAELEQKLQEKFGRTISYGIGVNCGDAVVGNIGCDFRMDYTAIGDTVNTAARLESNAKAGQILISDAVYEAIKDRVQVTEIGTIPLKGKSKEVMVYQVDNIRRADI